VIRLRDVHFGYGGGELVLAGANLLLGDGLTLLLGPNGCGKSTLLKVLAGIERPAQGTVEIEGFDLWKEEVAARQNLAYVPEQPDLTPYATIDEILALVCRLRGEPLAAGRKALERAGLSSLRRRSVRELSMGQRRRAVLAAAWIGSPRIVLLDEPLEALDRAIRTQTLGWIDGMLHKGAAAVIATHEIEPFAEKATRALTVRSGSGRLYESLPSEPRARMLLLEALALGNDPP
jgi:ABC-type multidrug transport system ATPase subunit